MSGQAAVFGAGGGIGGALAAALEASGVYERVTGFKRPDVDVTDEASVVHAAETLKDGPPLRLCIVATGFLHDGRQGPEKSMRDLDAEALTRSFQVNAIGPAIVMKHVLPLLPREGEAKFAAISARVGSIGDNGLGGWYGYRASKAALNQFVKTAAVEIGRRRKNACCVALHPGTVATALSEPFAKSGLDVRLPEEAASDLLRVLDRLGPEDTGGFFDHMGEPIPW